MKTLRAFLALFVLHFGIETLPAQPAYLNYQGRLTDTAGNPITGQTNVEFSIYPVALGGTAVWGPFVCDGDSGVGHTAKAYLNTDGRFNVILGDLDTGGRSILAAFTNSADRFVEIKVGAGQPIQPRQKFLSAPYAVQSVQAIHSDIAANLVTKLAEALCPPGTILAFAGPTNRIPSGWLWCDGRAVSSADYPALYEAIGISWGNGVQSRQVLQNEDPPNTSTDFNLPDLRSVFLRGATADAQTNAFWGDQDFASRAAARTGGNMGNAVGSIQDSQIKAHTHTYALAGWSDNHNYSFWDSGDLGTLGSVATSSVGGPESRPKNAYVNYIIKY